MDRDMETAMAALRKIAALADENTGMLDDDALDAVHASLGTMMLRDYSVLGAVVDVAVEAVYAIDTRARGGVTHGSR